MALSQTSRGNAAVYPEKVCNIISDCAVLHNNALVNGVPCDVPVQPDEPMPMEPWPAQPPLGAMQRRQDVMCSLVRAIDQPVDSGQDDNKAEV